MFTASLWAHGRTIVLTCGNPERMVTWKQKHMDPENE